MYCTQCGVQAQEAVNFCPNCGHPFAQATSGSATPRRLYRSRQDKKLGGVCGGLADYFQLDPTLVRLLVVTAIFVSGGLVALAYIVAWIIVPVEPAAAH